MRAKLDKQVVHPRIQYASIGGSSHLASLRRVWIGPRLGYRLQKTSFRILVDVY